MSNADDIATNAIDKPKKVENDGFQAEQHSIKDQIAADRHQTAQNAGPKKLGLRFSKLIPPGAG